ncbi:MBL fold metallo-hydrolase [Erysipelotrichaceae bacterium OttesenSCG-928-M19]|nr:MBL fold metallo-hydrolase [Erysipelotrichaceae bacterium OttesenSCG-928-M19]
MKVEKIVNSFIDENTYFIYENKVCLIVDPGSDFERIDAFIQEQEFDKIYIYLTHAHPDHIASCQALYDKYHCPVYTHELELDLLKQPIKNLSASFDEDMVIDYAQGKTTSLDIPEIETKLYHVPGHTHGHSMIEVVKLNALFVGDFVFYHEIGRCDLPTSDINEMYESLDKLVLMDPKLAIYPGHGQMTTLKEEIAHNPYINR